jgi:hypothetical protein
MIKIKNLLFLLSFALLSGCVDTGYQPAYIIWEMPDDSISEEEIRSEEVR